jgi:hypothetical protein
MAVTKIFRKKKKVLQKEAYEATKAGSALTNDNDNIP